MSEDLGRVCGVPRSVPVVGWAQQGCAGSGFWDEFLWQMRTLGLCCSERVDQGLVDPQLFLGIIHWMVWVGRNPRDHLIPPLP